ncbi:Uncharacterised protein [Sphingobacterium daejeonense]|nr:Uncharacterised protein [Sphingobacterium daejeonense]
MLLKSQIILVKDLVKTPQVMDRIQIPKDKQSLILKEANELINSPLEHE